MKSIRQDYLVGLPSCQASARGWSRRGAIPKPRICHPLAIRRTTPES